MLDEVLDRAGEEVEIEDILGKEILFPALKALVGKAIKLTAATRKPTVAAHLVARWAEKGVKLPDTVVVSRAEALRKAIGERFDAGVPVVATARATSLCVRPVLSMRAASRK